MDLNDTVDFIEAVSVPEDDPRRKHQREKRVISLDILVNGKKMEAVTMDLSTGGAKIFYLCGYIPVDAKIVIDCKDVRLPSREAVAVWSDQQEKTYSVSGLKFISQRPS